MCALSGFVLNTDLLVLLTRNIWDRLINVSLCVKVRIYQLADGGLAAGMYSDDFLTFNTIIRLKELQWDKMPVNRIL